MFISRGVIRQYHELHRHVLMYGSYIPPGTGILGMNLHGMEFRAYEHEDYDYNGNREGGYYALFGEGWRITSTPSREAQAFGDRTKMMRDLLHVKLSGVLDYEAD